MSHDRKQASSTSPATDAGFEELAEAADTLFLAMRKARSRGADAGGLSLAQMALLDPLSLGGDLPVGQLASAAGVSVPTATRMLQQLETKGIVTRRRSPEDERRVLISLTEEGVERLTRLREQRRERQALGYAAFAPAERAQLAEQLNRLAEIINGLD
ncbi:MarR family winged helix-turn-helix transcriptional regulator [Kitasatospora kifunensis]|uniref:DNA-binding MarR family transcriptional regulator n=1 Tax=Kitasatospora kifunensis TaxID=58351 RepID=A0A7W7R6V0_KITKI|nr:MarR family transcriptional regulator [Kitasatospora kifunensis]MBB4926508.1 DNA-binding MarR family transcriptional regulator [Kitasatospora kifunensis]